MTTQLPIQSAPREPDRPPVTSGGPRLAPPKALMTAAGLEAVHGELARLRRSTRLEIEQRLREARSYGDGSNNDEHHAVREDQMVREARIAALDGAIARATVIDPADARQGVAVIGSAVTIEDLTSGATTQYRLASAHSLGAGVISAASPMGQALIGALPGTTLTIELPNGRSRRVRLVDVKATESDT
jgi:transcription elongation factor GreA